MTPYVQGEGSVAKLCSTRTKPLLYRVTEQQGVTQPGYHQKRSSAEDQTDFTTTQPWEVTATNK